MFITRQADYAIRIMIYLAHNMGKTLTVSYLAQKTNVPKSFLPRIISTLANRRLVITEKGKKGGVRLARKPEEVTIYDVIEAIDGVPVMNVCVDWDDACPYTEYCKMHKLWKELQEQIEERLKSTTLADVIVDYGALTAQEEGQGS